MVTIPPITPVTVLIFLIVYVITYAVVKNTLQHVVVPLLIAGGAAWYVYNLLISMGL